MRSQRTTTAPPIIEDLGDGTFYYNFSVTSATMTDIMGNSPTLIFSYEQVRCKYPVVLTDVQQAVDLEMYIHTVLI